VPSNNPVLRNTLELQLALEAVKNEAAAKAAEQTQSMNSQFQQELLNTQKQAYERALAQAKEVTGANNRLVVLGLLLMAGMCGIVFLVVIVNLMVNMRNNKKQNDQFMETLRTVSEMSRAPLTALPNMTLQALPPLYGTGEPAMRLIGNSMKETGLPPPPVTENEKKELADLALKCQEIGTLIDQATNRKNNSKNVAEMVFKIVQEMGMPQYEATLFFAVSMVYDVGFLEIDRKLLQEQNLNEEQKFEIRNHVKQGLAQLSFVPEKYMPVFADGVLMHHENMDGSGYPEGLAGTHIPYIARLIHVCESFVALISRRNYREIFDKESAVEELRKKQGLYDPEIVEILDRII